MSSWKRQALSWILKKKGGGKKGISDGRTEIDIVNEILKARMNHQ